MAYRDLDLQVVPLQGVLDRWSRLLYRRVSIETLDTPPPFVVQVNFLIFLLSRYDIFAVNIASSMMRFIYDINGSNGE